MNCAQARELLSALLDQALTSEEEGRVRKHLVSCEACRVAHEELSETVRLIREAPADLAPEGFAETVLRARPVRRRAPRPLLWLAPMAAAACLLLIASLAGGPRRGSAPPASGAGAPAVKVARELVDADDAGEEKPAPVEELEGLAAGASARSGPEPAPDPAGDYRGPAGEVPPGMRTPSDPLGAPEEPSRPRAPSGPTSVPGEPQPEPVAPPAPGGGEARGKSELDPPAQAGAGPVDRKYLVRGMEPDAAAGVILAELNRMRSQPGAGTATRADVFDEARNERLVPDLDGTPARLLLDLTSEEMALVEDVICERRTAEILRTNGGRSGEPGAGGGASRRPRPEEKEGGRPDRAGGRSVQKGPAKARDAGGADAPADVPPRGIAQARRLRVLIEFARP